MLYFILLFLNNKRIIMDFCDVKQYKRQNTVKKTVINKKRQQWKIIWKELRV